MNDHQRLQINLKAGHSSPQMILPRARHGLRGVPATAPGPTATAAVNLCAAQGKLDGGGQPLHPPSGCIKTGLFSSPECTLSLAAPSEKGGI